MKSQLSNNLSAYPVFIMYEQLNLNGYYESDFGLDEIWENCCIHYDNFVKSKFNDEFQSEYDCISDYVKALIKSYQSQRLTDEL